MTKVYNRKTKEILDLNHMGAKPLKFIYSNKILTNLFTNRFITKIYCHNKLRISKLKINKFIKKNNIDMSLFEDKKYKNYNEFFTRKYKNIDFNKNAFISPCDSKLSVYKIDDNLKVKVKNLIYTVPELFNNNIDDLNNSYMFIYRLDVDDCHRYYYIDDGEKVDRVRIKGKFHTVSDYSDKYKIYKENEREYTVLNTKNFGKVIFMEVGALLIGKIINHDMDTFKRGDEKGYFLPGGSTIIVIAKNIKVDEDILKYSKMGIETKVSIGERVGIYDEL